MGDVVRLLLSLASLLVTLAGVAAFVFYNSAFMCMVGHATYAPPNSGNGMRAAFAALSGEASNIPGVTLGGVADARAACIGVGLPPPVAEGVRRFNLVLLGAGARSLSPVIAPEARYLSGLRPDLTGEAGVNFVTLSERQAALAKAELAALANPDAPIYRDLDIAGGPLQERFRRTVTRIASPDGDLARCMPPMW